MEREMLKNAWTTPEEPPPMPMSPWDHLDRFWTFLTKKRRLLKLIKQIDAWDRLPRGWGACWHSPEFARATIAIIPLNIVLRAGYIALQWARFPFRRRGWMEQQRLKLIAEVTQKHQEQLAKAASIAETRARTQGIDLGKRQMLFALTATLERFTWDEAEGRWYLTAQSIMAIPGEQGRLVEQILFTQKSMQREREIEREIAKTVDDPSAAETVAVRQKGIAAMPATEPEKP